MSLDIFTRVYSFILSHTETRLRSNRFLQRESIYLFISFRSQQSISKMNAELSWTRTVDHLRLAKVACVKSSCLAAAANISQHIQLDPLSRSGLVICTANQDEDTRGGHVDCLAFHLNSWLDSLPTVPTALKRLIQDWIDSVRRKYPIVDTSPIKLRTRASRQLVR